MPINLRRLKASNNTVSYHSRALLTAKKSASIIYMKITDIIQIKFSGKIAKTTYNSNAQILICNVSSPSFKKKVTQFSSQMIQLSLKMLALKLPQCLKKR